MHENHPQLEAFDRWLAKSPPATDPRFLQRIRDRLAQETAACSDVDAVLDDLLSQPPPPPDPDFGRRLRLRIRAENRHKKTRWVIAALRPIAAAAVLGFAFFVFQQDSPPMDSITVELETMLQTEPTVDAQLDAIFALANELPAGSSVTRMPTPAALSLLMQ